MNSIEIYINNIGIETNIIINNKNNLITINNKTKEISEEKINDLIRIIRTWKNEYKNKKKIDSETFKIIINSNTETETITGNGDYPDNYNTFKEWIDDINE